MHILHTESSNGWGGQEMRILREALGFIEKGHHVSIACVRGGKLGIRAREKGIPVFDIDFKKPFIFKALMQLMALMKQVDVVNTHSSLDAWVGGMAARLMRKPVVRTRHLSTPIKGGLNARLLYNGLADYVVTTSSCILPTIQEKSCLPADRLQCIPTGVEPFQTHSLRESLGFKPDDILIGTVCVVRSWKGIQDMIAAAKLLRAHKNLKWLVIGGGYLENFKPLVDPELPFIFTGHQDDPKPYLAALDIFTLLSTAHEGISQASLQAAYLKKPLITTPIGGLPEVCLHAITGLIVPPSSPEQVADAVLKLAHDPALRTRLGDAGHAHAVQNFTFSKTLKKMEEVFALVAP